MSSSSSSSKRHPRIVGVSTKMYFDPTQTSTYVSQLPPLADLSSNVQTFIIPDFLTIPTTCTALASSKMLIGAQDCHWEDQGAFTGEVSARHLKSFGVGMVELGHAERRRLFAENDGNVALKAKSCERNGLVPLVCIGEINKGSISDAVEEVRPQITSLLEILKDETEVIFAYEPVWAIGQPKPAESSYVVEVTKGLRAIAHSVRGCDVEKKEGGERSGMIRIIYGGSAGPGLFNEIKDGVDGLFLGRFGHDVGNFKRCIEELASA